MQRALRTLAGSFVFSIYLFVQIDKCFGFDTAVEEAQRALMAAKVEASSAFRGIGIVKLMGRQSGFIAMQVTHQLPLLADFSVQEEMH